MKATKQSLVHMLLPRQIRKAVDDASSIAALATDVTFEYLACKGFILVTSNPERRSRVRILPQLTASAAAYNLGRARLRIGSLDLEETESRLLWTISGDFAA